MAETENTQTYVRTYNTSTGAETLKACEDDPLDTFHDAVLSYGEDVRVELWQGHPDEDDSERRDLRYGQYEPFHVSADEIGGSTDVNR